jgi:hypothetical protein
MLYVASQEANLTALKCLNDQGNGYVSDIIGMFPNTPKRVERQLMN